MKRSTVEDMEEMADSMDASFKLAAKVAGFALIGLLLMALFLGTKSEASSDLSLDYGRMTGKDNYWNEGSVKYEIQSTENKITAEAGVRNEKTNNMVKGNLEYRSSPKPLYFFGDINYERNDSLRTDEIFGGAGVGIEIMKIKGAASASVGSDYSLLIKKGLRSRFRATAMAEYLKRKLNVELSYIVPNPEFKALCEFELLFNKSFSLIQVVEFSHMNDITDYSESTKLRMRF